MGLDITHYKATLKKPLKTGPFNRQFVLESEFEGFDVPFYYFQDYIQDVDTPKIFETIIFPKREDEIDDVIAFLGVENYHFLFEKHKKNLNIRVEKFVTDNNLIGNLIHSWEADKWFGFHIYNFKKQKGFYFEEIGEQRKGMNENFWNRFTSDKIFCFTQKEDFDYALSCVDFYRDDDTLEAVEMRKQLFKENFVDKYEFNKSWMSLSY